MNRHKKSTSKGVELQASEKSIIPGVGDEGLFKHCFIVKVAACVIFHFVNSLY